MSDPADIERKRQKHEDKLAEQREREEMAKARQAEIKASWASIDQSKAILSLLDYLDEQRDGYVNASVAGIAATKDGETVSFTPEQRISNLDRAAGIDVVIAYIRRYQR